MPVASIDDDEIFAERRGRGDHVSRGIHREAGAIEYDLIVAAHLIDDDRGNVVPPHHGAEHLLAQLALAEVEGRGVDADDHLRALPHQLVDGVAAIEPVLPELLVVPGVFADGEGDVVAVGAARSTASRRARSSALHRKRRRWAAEFWSAAGRLCRRGSLPPNWWPACRWPCASARRSRRRSRAEGLWSRARAARRRLRSAR